MTIVTEWGGYKTMDSEKNWSKSVLGKRSSRNKNKDNDDESSENGSKNQDEEIDLLKILGKKAKTTNSDNFYTMDNNIYFQDEISLETISSLNREIRELSKELIDFANKYDLETPPPIKLHITSYGGSVIAAFSAIDCIESCKVPVHTIIDGYAASAATLISVCGAKRYIKKHASMLIHQVRSGMWGKMSEIEDDYLNLQKTHDQIKQIYVEKTTLKRKNLSKILKHDIDWDAKTCLENGLVDEII
jgi:ATP-dependent protease ClpP protease subunit